MAEFIDKNSDSDATVISCLFAEKKKNIYIYIYRNATNSINLTEINGASLLMTLSYTLLITFL